MTKTRALALLSALVLLSGTLWADCAPDYRSDKKSGISITEFAVNGAEEFDSSELASIRSKLVGACVDEDSDEIEQIVRSIFQNRGYFGVSVSSIRTKVNDPLAIPKQARLEAEIDLGVRYRLASIRFVGNTFLPEMSLRKGFPLAKGDVLERDKIASGLGALRKLYLTRGFRDSYFVPDTSLHSNGTAVLNVTVTEGPQYHMGKLKIAAKKEMADRLQGAWHLKEGSVFNSDYLEKYIKANESLLPSGFTQANVLLAQDCPHASVEVALVIDQTDPMLQTRQPDVKCESTADAK